MTRRFTSMLLAIGLAVSALGLAPIAQAASSPTVSVSRPTSITNSSATVSATIHPDGAETFYVVQSGLTTSYGVTSAAKALSGRAKSASVSVKLTGLLPGTVYHYRIILISKYGSATSPDHQVRTTGSPPADVATGAAQLGTPYVVLLTGVVNPHSAATAYFFQYGQNGLPVALDSQTAPQSLPANTGPRNVGQLVGGLAPNTTYHFQLVAVHAGGVRSLGAYQTFTTYPAPRPRPVIRAGISPHRARQRPYAFAIFGSLRGPSTFPASLDCSGNVVAKFQLGRRVIDTELTTLSPSCRFSEVAIFRHLPGHGRRNRTVRLKVTITFRGNHYLFPVSARPIRLLLG